ncbi:MAG: hypothetical protein WAW17_19745 [Rhodococcus sp. (in: high G+C Gram-positive bacteria)]|uniref:hypothetical protein n=1 Tax=Rhodococcus sp. TaxID=1831 RepID=UPI003BB17CEB
MGMHDDDGIYTATCRYFRATDPYNRPRGNSTTQHTSQAAALEALHQALHAARIADASRVDVVLTRDDTPRTQVIFAAGPRDIDRVHPELDKLRPPYSRAWEILTTHANDILPELRNPHSPVHQPFSPELRDVTWSAQNVYDARQSSPSSDMGESWVRQHESLERHLAGEIDRAKDRARGAGHSEAQIDAAARTDPDLDMKSLRQHSAAMLDTVRDLTEHPTLTPQQRQALLGAVDRAENTVAELAGEPTTDLNVDPGIGAQHDAHAAARLAASDFPAPARSVLVSVNQPAPPRNRGTAPTQNHSLGL